MDKSRSWNWKKDLELLQERIGNFSAEDIRKLREAISPFINNSATSSSSTSSSKRARYDFPEDKPTRALRGSGPFSELTADGAVREVIRIFRTFEVYAREEAQRENIDSYQEMDNKHSNVNIDDDKDVVSGISLQKLQSVLSAFEARFRSQVVQDLEKADPLSNPLILQNIMTGNLGSSDLKNCTLVSKLWNATAVPLIRSSHYPIILSSTTDVAQICDNVESTSLLPRARFQVDLFRANQNHATDIGRFFKGFGEFVTQLDIFGEDSEEEDEDLTNNNDPVESDLRASNYTQACQDILRNVPNLSEVDFHLFPKAFPAQPTLYRAVFNNFILPKVRKLTLGSEVVLSLEFLSRLFGVLPGLTWFDLYTLPETQDYGALATSMSSCKRLEEFEDNCPLPPLFWNTLSSSAAEDRLKLKRLHVCVDDAGTEEDQLALRSYLLTQRDSLEYLRLVPEISTNPLALIPVLGRLKGLCLSHNDGTPGQCSYAHLNFVPSLIPAVKTITACTKCFTGAFQRQGCVCVYESVEEVFLKRLPFPSEGHRITTASPQVTEFTKMSSMCPNLKSLIITNGDQPAGIHKEDLGAIFKNFPNLTELYLHVCQDKSIEDLNYVLSGIPYEYEPIVRQVMGRKNCPDFDTLLVPLFCSDKAPPSLRDMKALQKLKIAYNVRGFSNSPPVSDLAVHMAFLQMQSLARLDLGGKVMISDEDTSKLSRHHMNVYIREYAGVSHCTRFMPPYAYMY